MTDGIDHSREPIHGPLYRLAVWGLTLGIVFVLAAFFLHAWRVKPVDQTPIYRAATQCVRVGLQDADSGWAVRGAEDIAIDRKGGRLFISAYDRRHVEAHLARRSRHRSEGRLPAGGLYPVTLADLRQALRSSAKPILTVQSLVRPDDLTGGLHPHGIDYDVMRNEIAFINRRYERGPNGWERDVVLERVGGNGAIVMGEAQKLPQAANDIAIVPSDVVVSVDHGGTGVGAVLEDIFGLRRSGIQALSTTKPLLQGIGFANGVNGRLGFEEAPRDSQLTDQIVVAATRDKSVYLIDRNGQRTARVRVPGGPDNLSVATDGSILAAVHPSLLRMGAHRKLGLGRAPSRVVRITPGENDVELLFEDPAGKHFQAATIAISADGLLILGSVTDRGLMVCEADQPINSVRTAGAMVASGTAHK
ncbi:MAG: hypothetical protein AAFR29_00910 [Pseudomonadota bacterium]